MELKLLRNLKKGGYVEFNISGDEKRYDNWSDTSFFLDEEVFYIFAECFDRSAENFNYYGPTKYSVDNLRRLQKELQDSAVRLAEISDFESFQDTILRLTSRDYLLVFLQDLERESFDMSVDWEEIVRLLKNINHGLLGIVEECIREEQVFWVLGI